MPGTPPSAPSPPQPIPLRRLLRYPGLALVSLLMLSALFRPYAGITHDARLYALQLLSRLQPGTFDQDLYLKFGSQDSYSLFSSVAEPMARIVGVPAAFFLLYLAGNACWIWALLRWVPRLSRYRVAAGAALLYLAVNPLPFGGFRTFHVNENFLTPRVWAVALVVFGMERLLRQRSLTAGLVMIGAMLLHPIMGVCGLCLVILCELRQRCSVSVFAGLVGLGVAILAAVLAWPYLGTRVFGQIDPVWRQHATGTNGYAVPLYWLWEDWLAIAAAFALVSLGRCVGGLSAAARRLLEATLLLAAVGLAVGVVAPYLPYRILLQGQAYRALWPLQLIQVPMLFVLVTRYARGRLSPASRLATVIAVLAFLAGQLTSWRFVAGGLALSAAGCWWWSRQQPNSERTASLQSMARMALAGSLVPTTLGLVWIGRLIADHYDPLLCLGSVTQVVGPVLAWGAAAGLLAWMLRKFRSPSRFGWSAACVWLAVQGLCFAIPASGLYETWRVRKAQEAAFVQQYLAQRQSNLPPVPGLYWPVGPLDEIWVRLQCTSYYSVPQTAGNLFNRGTAMEGNRRAQLAREFELSAREAWLQGGATEELEAFRRIFGRALDTQPPTLADLERLCREPEIDFVVTAERFEGWYDATDGQLYIYDARKVLEQLADRAAASSQVATRAGDDQFGQP